MLAVPRLYKWRQPENILLATNSFETNPEILNSIFTLVDLYKANLHVIVFTDSDTAKPEDYKSHKNHLDEYHAFLEKIKKDVLVTSAHLKGSEFEDTVQQYIDEHSIDMLAMITYKEIFWRISFIVPPQKTWPTAPGFPCWQFPLQNESTVWHIFFFFTTTPKFLTMGARLQRLSRHWFMKDLQQACMASRIALF